ncbi:hypothetical protein [Cellulophaga baltica]|uniref:hypothetical protein n=1 Tax=Cellulophaga baltica TaxID=76594 RepID=UPI002494D04A|nr:hypothetical protein [Cellulophaga baltica]
MLNHLNKIETHGIYQLHDDVLNFFQNCINYNEEFGEVLFSDNLWAVISAAKDLEGYFVTCFNALNENGVDKQIIYDNLLANNRVVEFCRGDVSYEQIDIEIYNDVNSAIITLYGFLWSSTMNNATTKSLYGDIKSHYNDFFDANCVPLNLCPFCGLERYLRPKKMNWRDDYDHYLYQKNYPFLRINFDNLVPMPGFCNGKYVKHVQDMLKVHETNIPRLAYYPYHNVADFTISISCVEMFSENEEWSITLKREGEDFSEEFETWKTVFKIEGRFLNEIEEHYESWIIELYNRNIEDIPDDIASLDLAINGQIADLKKRAVVPGYFLHDKFWQFILISEDIIKEQILFFIDQSKELVA